MTGDKEPINYQELFSTSDSPADYSNSIYLFYIELAQITEQTDRLVLQCLEHSKRKQIVNRTSISYLIYASIQDIPNLVRDFGVNNIAVYQVIRLSKMHGLV